MSPSLAIWDEMSLTVLDQHICDLPCLLETHFPTSQPISFIKKMLNLKLFCKEGPLCFQLIIIFQHLAYFFFFDKSPLGQNFNAIVLDSCKSSLIPHSLSLPEPLQTLFSRRLFLLSLAMSPHLGSVPFTGEGIGRGGTTQALLSRLWALLMANFWTK